MPRIMTPLRRRARAPRPSARACAGSAWPRPTKIASPIRKWPMLSSATSGMAATALHRGVVEAVAGVDLEPERRRPGRAALEPLQQCAARCAAGRRGLAVGAGMELHHLARRAASPHRAGGVRLDEERDADAGLASSWRTKRGRWCRRPQTSRPPSVVPPRAAPGTRQAACGRGRGAIASISSVTAISRFSGRSAHAQIGRVDVGVGDVPAVLAQVGGDAVGAGERHPRGAHRVGMPSAARVPDGRDVVDVDAEAKRTLLHGSGLDHVGTAGISPAGPVWMCGRESNPLIAVLQTAAFPLRHRTRASREKAANIVQLRGTSIPHPRARSTERRKGWRAGRR